MSHKSLCPLSDPRLPLRPLLLPVFSLLWPWTSCQNSNTVNQYLRHLPLGAFPGVLTLRTDVWLVSTLRALTLLNSYKHLFLFASLTWLILYYACVYSVISDSSQPHGLEPSRLLCPWNFPGKNTGVDCHLLFQGIFSAQ